MWILSLGRGVDESFLNYRLNLRPAKNPAVKF